MINQVKYAIGGTVQASDGLYIPRQADIDLLALCQRNDYARIWTPRQMGKSSLMIRTAERLVEDGTKSVIIDLTGIGSPEEACQWYLGLITSIADQVSLKTEPLTWWDQHGAMGFAQRLCQFFENVMLREVHTNIIVFIDEIDITRGLAFTADFFGAIRHLHDQRALHPNLRRLSFVLIGAHPVGPGVGQQVVLTDFTPAEAQPLAEGLCLDATATTQVLQWVMEWTAGHPYLTSRLFRALQDTQKKTQQASFTKTDVDEAVNKTFLGDWGNNDDNLQYVREMLTKNAPPDSKAELLTIYHELRRRRRVPDDDHPLASKNHLKLSGVVCRKSVPRKQALLRIRNLIYWEFFNSDWVRHELELLQAASQPISERTATGS